MNVLYVSFANDSTSKTRSIEIKSLFSVHCSLKLVVESENSLLYGIFKRLFSDDGPE